MTTIVKDTTAKFAVALVAVAMIFSAFASTASAQEQSAEDLQQMINDLLAQVSNLQSQVGTETSMVTGPASVCPYTWTRNLTSGATGMDVMMLQQFLNADPDTRVAAAGSVGSAGMETDYFGPATGAAVAKYQMKYRAEILTPLGLVAATQYYGNSTRSHMNGSCVSAPVVIIDDIEEDIDDIEEDIDDIEEEDDNSSMTLRGEASLDSLEIDSASDDEIEEGSSNQEVAEVTVEFTDGDAEISRMDVKFERAGADAFNAFETISLWVDGDMIAERDADDEDEFQNDEMTMRFSGLDLFAEEDEEVEIVVAVSTQNNLDSEEIGQWDVSVESMRFFDADGVATTEDDGFGDDFSIAETFTIQVEGTDDELIVKTSSNDPDAATLQVEDDSKSDWYNVFTFDLDTDDSVNDIELNTVDVTVTVSSSTYALIVDDAELVIDGVTIDDVTVDAGTSTVVLTFDVDGDVTINAGDRVEAELMLRFKSLGLGNEGITVMAEVTSTNADDIDAEGADDLDATQLSGAADGDPHTLRTAGVDVSLETTSADTTSVEAASDYGTYSIEVEVTAFEQDVYISTDPAVAVGYDLESSAGSSTAAGTRTVVLESTGDESAGYFEVTEGSTETFTLTVTYTPGEQTAARMLLQDINFAATAIAPDQTQTTLPETDYRTSVVTIND